MKETILKAAMEMTIMDAIENGHIDKSELIEYMKSETFKTSVNSYVKKFESEFK